MKVPKKFRQAVESRLATPVVFKDKFDDNGYCIGWEDEHGQTTYATGMPKWFAEWVLLLLNDQFEKESAGATQ